MDTDEFIKSTNKLQLNIDKMVLSKPGNTNTCNNKQKLKETHETNSHC